MLATLQTFSLSGIEANPAEVNVGVAVAAIRHGDSRIAWSVQTDHHIGIAGTARVFDIAGDGREEVIIWNRNEIAIYWNPDPPPHPVPPKRTDRDYLLRSRHGSFAYNYPQ